MRSRLRVGSTEKSHGGHERSTRHLRLCCLDLLRLLCLLLLLLLHLCCTLQMLLSAPLRLSMGGNISLKKALRSALG